MREHHPHEVCRRPALYGLALGFSLGCPVTAHQINSGIFSIGGDISQSERDPEVRVIAPWVL
ncbi:hypothetical protein FIBSPDRAFT_851466 [Athelia psychrophila]|uniref:Uncharacterized protein n=1 Tax=Athelia psychrophila TaxID=1759441 RepID=A0A166SHX1_9AGAM|nr:hypothetical protein FIBSPDRAFT_851466 [Fibularhizoctonia sp. CBS 109695]